MSCGCPQEGRAGWQGWVQGGPAEMGPQEVGGGRGAHGPVGRLWSAAGRCNQRSPPRAAWLTSHFPRLPPPPPPRNSTEWVGVGWASRWAVTSLTRPRALVSCLTEGLSSMAGGERHSLPCLGRLCLHRGGPDRPLNDDEWVDGQTDRWIGGWLHRRMDGWVDGWMDRQTDGWMVGQTDGWVDGRTDRRMGEWMDG